MGRKTGKSKEKRERKRERRREREGKRKRKVEGRKLKKSWTHGHLGDFILCPMLCIALDRQKCGIFISETVPWVFSAKKSFNKPMQWCNSLVN